MSNRAIIYILTLYGAVAQLVERTIRIRKVVGSIPICSTIPLQCIRIAEVNGGVDCSILFKFTCQSAFYAPYISTRKSKSQYFYAKLYDIYHILLSYLGLLDEYRSSSC